MIVQEEELEFEDEQHVVRGVPGGAKSAAKKGAGAPEQPEVGTVVISGTGKWVKEWVKICVAEKGRIWRNGKLWTW